MKIIAEIGWNHMGDLDLALHMTEQAAKSGADIVKFQTWRVENLTSGPWDTDGRRQIYEKAELTADMHKILNRKCADLGVTFMTSCFSSKDVPGVRDLSPLIKVPSTEIANVDLLSEIARCFSGEPDHHIFVSTGASLWDEVVAASDFLNAKKMNFTLLHCVSSYPCPAEKCNMPRMRDLQLIAQSVGYSGHYPGITDALVAIEMGASCVEKHFTTDHDLPGRDNKFAILPAELAQIKDYAVARQLMMTPAGKDHQQCELDMRSHYRGRWDKRA